MIQMRPSAYLITENLLPGEKELGVDVIGVSFSGPPSQQQLPIILPFHLSSRSLISLFPTELDTIRILWCMVLRSLK